ncbi:recombinase family protein [Massilia sp. BSC265]|uniref:recombinase family protein n=1 Tax=Massilia sp. BSC265 TaxID=1549812 RepID=UPI0009E0A592|nr:recombinase family protein [Massilia sp. BSC265]
MSGTLPTSAALYVRASTEHQNYSTDHQEAVLREYAASKGLEIVRIYCDKGRSGLTIDGRAGLLQLLSDIQSGRANFQVVLVYDVSRWGRFQDVDESAYYEFACRRVGIAVAYCAEPFANDGSPLETILKGIKRAMAAEYSRELSAKVFAAQVRLTEAGFKQGGTAGYGLRRMVLSSTGQPKGVLRLGERKNMPSDRVTYVPGPAEELAVINRIYGMYLDERLPDVGIAARLNSEGIATGLDRPWSAHLVKQVLTNEKYVGTMVFNRGTQRMHSVRRANNPLKWIRRESAFEGVVSRERFEQARAERRRRRKHWTDDEMLDALRDIMVEHGRVTPDLINASNVPSVKSYALRFNGLVSAMGLAGVNWPSLSRATITRYRLRCVTRDMTNELKRCISLACAQVESLTPRTWRINGVMVRLLCTRCRYERSHPCWKVTLTHTPAVDFVIWVRMDQSNDHSEQVYLIPVAEFPGHQYLWPSTRTLKKYERYAYPTLLALFGLG